MFNPQETFYTHAYDYLVTSWLGGASSGVSFRLPLRLWQEGWLTWSMNACMMQAPALLWPDSDHDRKVGSFLLTHPDCAASTMHEWGKWFTNLVPHFTHVPQPVPRVLCFISFVRMNAWSALGLIDIVAHEVAAHSGGHWPDSHALCFVSRCPLFGGHRCRPRSTTQQHRPLVLPPSPASAAVAPTTCQVRQLLLSFQRPPHLQRDRHPRTPLEVLPHLQAEVLVPLGLPWCPTRT